MYSTASNLLGGVPPSRLLAGFHNVCPQVTLSLTRPFPVMPLLSAPEGTGPRAFARSPVAAASASAQSNYLSSYLRRIDGHFSSTVQPAASNRILMASASSGGKFSKAICGKSRSSVEMS